MIICVWVSEGTHVYMLIETGGAPPSSPGMGPVHERAQSSRFPYPALSFRGYRPSFTEERHKGRALVL